MYARFDSSRRRWDTVSLKENRMGQYHIPVNLTKREYIYPHHMDSLLKMQEINGSKVSAALLLLICPSAGRGGGDIVGDEVAGRWAGDSIVLAGDCADDLPGKDTNLYHEVLGSKEWTNISDLCNKSMTDW